jgi:hypothetical protein
VAPDFAAARVALPVHQALALVRQGSDPGGRFAFRIDEVEG